MNRNRNLRKIHHQITAGVAAALVLTSIAPVSQGTAYAASTKLICTQQEHTHDSSCYTASTTLICGQTEGEEHTHTDACYQTTETLTCTIPEHTHTAECYVTVTAEPTESTEKINGNSTETADSSESLDIEEIEDLEDTEDTEEEEKGDPTADVENAAIWSQSVSGVKLTGVYADDLIAIAKTQLGYTESTRNFILNEKKEKKGYTRYGAWYGAPYMDWCAMFVSFCLNYAGVSSEEMPRFGNCQKWIDSLSYLGMYETRDSYEPIPGDLVFFEWDGDGVSDHIGIVYQVTKDENGNVTGITTIEGNASNMVRTKSYLAGDADIMGYGKLPQGKNYKQSVEIDQLIITAEYTGHANLANAVLYAETVEEDDKEVEKKELFQAVEEEYTDAQIAKAEYEEEHGITSEEKNTIPESTEQGNTESTADTDDLDYLLIVGFHVGTDTDVVPEDDVTYTITVKDKDEESETETEGTESVEETTETEEAAEGEEATEEETEEATEEETDPDFYILPNPDVVDKDQPTTDDAEKDGYDTLDFDDKNKAEFKSDTAVVIASNAAGSAEVSTTPTATSVPNAVAAVIQDNGVAVVEESTEAESTSDIFYFRCRNQKKPK